MMISRFVKLPMGILLALWPFSASAQSETPNDQEIFYQCFAQQKVDGYTSPEFCRCVSDLAINRLNPDDYSRALADYRYINQLRSFVTSRQQSGLPISAYDDKAGRIISDCIPCQQSGSVDCVAELDQARLWSDYQAIASNLRNGYFDRVRTGRSYSRFFTDVSIIATNFCKPIIEYPMEFWTETEDSEGIVISRTEPVRIDSRLEENYDRHAAVWAREATTSSLTDFFQSLKRQEISLRPLNEALWMIQLRQGLANYLGAGCQPGDVFHDTYKNMILFELGQPPRLPADRGAPIGMAIDGIDEDRLSKAMAAIEQRQQDRQAALAAAGPLNCVWDERLDGPPTVSVDPAGTYKTTINGETVHFALYPRRDLVARGDEPVRAYQGLGVIADTQCIVTLTLSRPRQGTARFTMAAHASTGEFAPCAESAVFQDVMPGGRSPVVIGLDGVAESVGDAALTFSMRKVPWVSQDRGQCQRDARLTVERATMSEEMIAAVMSYESAVLRPDSSKATRLAPDGFWDGLAR